MINLTNSDQGGIPVSHVTGPSGLVVGGFINGALFQQGATRSGSGVFRDVFRLQHLNNSGPQSGYNRVVSGLNTSTVGGESIRLRVQDLVLDTTGAAYSFVMDVNEGGGSQSRISLDRLIIWVDPSGTADTIPGTGSTMPNSLSLLQSALGVAPVYDMDAGGNNTVLVDGGIHAGSGLSDVSFFIPKSNFGNPAPNSYVYIWAEMGAYNATFAANSGNDSFAVPRKGTGLFLTPGAPIPEPEIVAFLLLLSPLILRRRRSSGRGETGNKEVKIGSLD